MKSASFFRNIPGRAVHSSSSLWDTGLETLQRSGQEAMEAPVGSMWTDRSVTQIGKCQRWALPCLSQVYVYEEVEAETPGVSGWGHGEQLSPEMGNAEKQEWKSKQSSLDGTCLLWDIRVEISVKKLEMKAQSSIDTSKTVERMKEGRERGKEEGRKEGRRQGTDP